MGGRNCTHCAAQNPERVAGLVLVDWSPENAPAGSKRVAETVARTPDVFASIEDAMRYFKTDPNSPEGAKKHARFEAYLKPVAGGFAIKRDPHFRNQFRRMIETGERPKQGVDMWAALAKVACPTLVLRGSRSDMFAAETVAKVVAANPRVKLVELDAGHHVAGDDPAGFLRETRAFLNAEEKAHAEGR
jgi:esterase